MRNQRPARSYMATDIRRVVILEHTAGLDKTVLLSAEHKLGEQAATARRERKLGNSHLGEDPLG